MITEFVLGVAVILLTGLIFSKIAKWTRVPDITGYLIGGLLIGPVFFKMIFPGFQGILGLSLIQTLQIVTDIELAFIAFTVGTEFKLSYFKKVGLMPVIIAFAESFAAVVFITGGMLIFGAPLYFALAMGAVGGATAPAATIMVIRQYKAKGELAQTLLSVTAIDDASALIFFGIAMAIVKSLIFKDASADTAKSIYMPFVEIIGSMGLGAVMGILLTFFMRFFKGPGNRLILTITALFFNIGICFALNKAFDTAFSSLMACIVTGMMFTNTSKVVDDVMPLVEGITPPLVVIFFILAGAGLNIEALSWVAAGFLVVYLVFRISGKVLGTVVSAQATKAPPKVKKWLGWGLLPQGGIAIGLSMIVMNTLNSPGAQIVNKWGVDFNGDLVRVIVLCAVFASEIFGPLLSKMAIMKSGEGIDDNARKKKAKPALAAATATPAAAAPATADSATAEPQASAQKTEASAATEPAVKNTEEK